MLFLPLYLGGGLPFLLFQEVSIYSLKKKKRKKKLDLRDAAVAASDAADAAVESLDTWGRKEQVRAEFGKGAQHSVRGPVPMIVEVAPRWAGLCVRWCGAYSFESAASSLHYVAWCLLLPSLLLVASIFMWQYEIFNDRCDGYQPSCIYVACYTFFDYCVY